MVPLESSKSSLQEPIQQYPLNASGCGPKTKGKRNGKKKVYLFFLLRGMGREVWHPVMLRDHSWKSSGDCMGYWGSNLSQLHTGKCTTHCTILMTPHMFFLNMLILSSNPLPEVGLPTMAISKNGQPLTDLHNQHCEKSMIYKAIQYWDNLVMPVIYFLPFVLPKARA